MTAAPYQPGDRVRVTVDEPYSTELRAGDVVTVISTGVKTELDGSELPIVVVSTNAGRRVLGLDVVEPAASMDYVPAEPDEIVDARLRALLDSEPDLAALFTDADTALGAEEATLSAQITAEQTTEGAVLVTGWEPTGPEPSYTWEDYAGDDLEVHYAERTCDAHGREAAFFFMIDHDVVLIPTEQIDGLIRFLWTNRNFSRRPE